LILCLFNLIANAKDAGTEAIRKNLGPQNTPPYQLHHLEYTIIKPSTRIIKSLYMVNKLCFMLGNCSLIERSNPGA